jgi:hypothetical protein
MLLYMQPQRDSFRNCKRAKLLCIHEFLNQSNSKRSCSSGRCAGCCGSWRVYFQRISTIRVSCSSCAQCCPCILYVHEPECCAHMVTLQDGRYPEVIFNSVNSAIYSNIRHSILGVSMIICYRSLNMSARAKK